MEYGGFVLHACGGLKIDSDLFKGNKDSPVMQYTGLEDKNGKEIYEGDIVKDDNKKIHEVRFLNASFVIYGEYNNKIQHWVIGQKKATQLKIIGNIYENPELLGVNDVRR